MVNIKEDLLSVTIDSPADFRKWFNSVDNKTYIINHDLEFWHKSGPPHRCFLHEKIHRRINTWENSSKLVRHDSRKQLWVTLKLPDHFCVTCGRRIREKYYECWSCKIRTAYAERPFYEQLPIRDAVLTTQEFEKGYRLFKFLEVGSKLRVTHHSCDNPSKCLHFRWYLNNRRGRLPKYTTKVIGDTTYVVKIIGNRGL